MEIRHYKVFNFIAQKLFKPNLAVVHQYAKYLFLGVSPCVYLVDILSRLNWRRKIMHKNCSIIRFTENDIFLLFVLDNYSTIMQKKN